MTQEKNKKTAVLLDGKKLAEEIKHDLAKKIRASGRHPGLAAILIGEDPASALYVGLKEKACLEVGIDFHKYLCNQACYPAVDEKQIIEMIGFLNHDPQVDGVLLQLPLPAEFNTEKIIASIDPKKDADNLSGKNPNINSPLTDAILELLKAVPDIKEKNRSALLIIKNDEFAEKLTSEIKKLGLEKIRRAKTIPTDVQNDDLIIIALGQAQALKKSMIRPGAIIIDVGINKKGKHVVGDVDPKAAEIAGYQSPVPGGVGPLTVACLLRNTFILSQKK